MTVTEEKKRYITYELGLLSLNAALSTRDKEYPIYAKGVKSDHQRKPAKNAFRAVLEDVEKKYSAEHVSDEDHVKYIETTAKNLSENVGDKLHERRFRIGVAQKLINLHLKYLWTSGYIQEPPHCPIDGIIRDQAKIIYDWTTNDSIDDYKKAVEELRKVAASTSLSAWELANFRRRDDE